MLGMAFPQGAYVDIRKMQFAAILEAIMPFPSAVEASGGRGLLELRGEKKHTALLSLSIADF